MCMLFRVMKMKMNICKINKMNKMMAFFDDDAEGDNYVHVFAGDAAVTPL